MPDCCYDAIIFDLDGTLIDSADIKTWAFGKLYESYGEGIVRQVISWHKQHEGISRFVKFRHWQENLLHEVYTEELGVKLSEAFSRIVVDAVVQAPYIEGALNFLEEYHQRIPLFVASGTPLFELQEILARRDMTRYFHGIHGSPLTKSEILDQIIIDNQWMPKRIVMIGDSISDWEGSQAVGTAFLGMQVREKGSLPEGGILLKRLDNLDQYLFR